MKQQCQFQSCKRSIQLHIYVIFISLHTAEINLTSPGHQNKFLRLVSERNACSVYIYLCLYLTMKCLMKWLISTILEAKFIALQDTTPPCFSIPVHHYSNTAAMRTFKAGEQYLGHSTQNQ
jgi:hypothetical protein